MLLTHDTARALWVPLLVLAAAVAVSFKMAGGSRIGLRRWAKANGYRLVASDRRYLDRGPFPEHAPRGLGVFHVTVEDESGRRRDGYVRCSIGFSALFLDEA